jgi:hypothetical protein
MHFYQLSIKLLLHYHVPYCSVLSCPVLSCTVSSVMYSTARALLHIVRRYCVITPQLCAVLFCILLYCTYVFCTVTTIQYSVIKLYNKENASEHCILHALFITGRHIFHSTRNLYILYRYCGSGRLFTDRNSLVWAGHLVLHKNKVFIL